MYLLGHPLNEAISNLLELMGNTSAADRVWMIEYSHDLLRFRNTHEWCRGKVTPYIGELQDAPTTLIAWLHKYMVKGVAVAINDVNTLPRNARVIQTEFLRQGNKSVLSVPIFQNETLSGLIGLDTTTQYTNWSSDTIGMLYECANLIGQAKYAIDRKPATASVRGNSVVTIYMTMRGLTRGVQPREIVGVRSAGNYCEIWFEDGTMSLDTRTFSVWLSLLPSKTFLQIHRTAIANALHILDIDRRNHDKWLVRMRSIDGPWPVSRSFHKCLRERMGI